MKHRTLIVLAAAALAGSALALASCNTSDPLAACTSYGLDIVPSFGLFVAVGDSAAVFAEVTADCSAIHNRVDFSVKSPSLATVTATSDTTAMLHGVAQGTTMLYVTPRDYKQGRDSVQLLVIARNP